MVGNYLNQGNERLSEANAFRINFLPQLDQIKLTNDNSISLMNVLAYLCQKEFPESVDIRKDLEWVEAASKSILKITNLKSISFNQFVYFDL